MQDLGDEKETPLGVFGDVEIGRHHSLGVWSDDGGAKEPEEEKAANLAWPVTRICLFDLEVEVPAHDDHLGGHVLGGCQNGREDFLADGHELLLVNVHILLVLLAAGVHFHRVIQAAQLRDNGPKNSHHVHGAHNLGKVLHDLGGNGVEAKEGIDEILG